MIRKLQRGHERCCAKASHPASAGYGAGLVPSRAPAALCALPALFFFALATAARPLAARLDQREPPSGEVAARIAELTKADDRIFVWEIRRSCTFWRTGQWAPGSRLQLRDGREPRHADANQLPAAWDM